MTRRQVERTGDAEVYVISLDHPDALTRRIADQVAHARAVAYARSKES